MPATAISGFRGRVLVQAVGPTGAGTGNIIALLAT